MKEIILADKRMVARGPYAFLDEEAKQNDGFNIGIDVAEPNDPGIAEKKILQIFNPVGDIALPLINVLEKNLWNKALRDKVVELLKNDGRRGKQIEYIISRVEGEFKQIQLLHSNKLIGCLRFLLVDRPGGSKSLQIMGDVENRRAGLLDNRILLEVNKLYALNVIVAELKPKYVKSDWQWGKKLENLIIEYLKTLAYFSQGNLRLQILEVADQLSTSNGWTAMKRQIKQKLDALGPNDLENEKIKQALKAIDDFCSSGK